MADYGRQVIGNTGIPVYVEASGPGEYAPVGVTIDWTTVAALGSDTTVNPEGVTLKAGQKYLPHGQVITRITNVPVQTVTVGDTGVGGTFTLAGYRTDTGAYVVVGPLAWNVSTADLLAALQAPAAFGPSVAAVTGTPGSSYVITGAFALMTVNGAGLTATPPAVTAALTTTPVQTITVGGTGVGGTFTLTGRRMDTGASVTVGPLAFDVSLAALKTALTDPAAFGPMTMTVTGTPGASYVITAMLTLLTPDGTLLTGTLPTIADVLTTPPAQTATLVGTRRGGTFTLAGYRMDTGAHVVVGPLAWNVSTAALATALQDAGAFDALGLTVTGTAGTSYVITGPLATLTPNGAGLTGLPPTIVNVLTTPVGNYGLYGPYDPDATDGRQVLTRGQCAVLNSLIVQNGILGNFTNLPTNHPGVLVGGYVWKARLKATRGAHSLAAGPTFTEFEAAFPRVLYVGSFPGP